MRCWRPVWRTRAHPPGLQQPLASSVLHDAAALAGTVSLGAIKLPHSPSDVSDTPRGAGPSPDVYSPATLAHVPLCHSVFERHGITDEEDVARGVAAADGSSSDSAQPGPAVVQPSAPPGSGTCRVAVMKTYSAAASLNCQPSTTSSDAAGVSAAMPSHRIRPGQGLAEPPLTAGRTSLMSKAASARSFLTAQISRGTEALAAVDRALPLGHQLGVVLLIGVFVMYPSWVQAALGVFACYAVDSEGGSPYPENQRVSPRRFERCITKGQRHVRHIKSASTAAPCTVPGQPPCLRAVLALSPCQAVSYLRPAPPRCLHPVLHRPAATLAAC